MLIYKFNILVEEKADNKWINMYLMYQLVINVIKKNKE